jgi:hypothetical protein
LESKEKTVAELGLCTVPEGWNFKINNLKSATKNLHVWQNEEAALMERVVALGAIH